MEHNGTQFLKRQLGYNTLTRHGDTMIPNAVLTHTYTNKLKRSLGYRHHDDAKCTLCLTLTLTNLLFFFEHNGRCSAFHYRRVANMLLQLQDMAVAKDGKKKYRKHRSGD